MTRDPVCFADVDERDATRNGLISQQEGKSYYFCSDDCKEQFEQDPMAYISNLRPDWPGDESSDYAR